ncbi:MAG TPA: DUF2721 domain-containing protein [Abditibacteriaceae bacterium]|jgi:hypothetical protein
MEFSLTTPALLFPAVSLLLLAYTNRFLALAALIRELHSRYKDNRDELLMAQIRNLRQRVMLIRNMQALGVSSLLLCVVCMFVLFAGWAVPGKAIFGISLLLLISSLALSIWEIQISVNALNLHLSDLEHDEEGKLTASRGV